MIITKLQHGLGNQLFQYAAGLSLAHKNRTMLKLDLTWFEFNTCRQYALLNFNIREVIATRNEIDIFFKNRLILKLKKHVRKYYNDFFNIDYFPYPISSNHFVEKMPGYDPDFFAMTGDVYLEGFWFSYKYILPEIEQRLRLELTPKLLQNCKVKLIEKQILESRNSIALHVRRGDYVSNINYSRRYGCLKDIYYKQAIEILKNKLSTFKIFVFTDDPCWVNQNFNIEDSVFVSGNELFDFEELYLMSKCSHQILANSSFSWWGGWLNTNPTKIIIAPKLWVNDSSIQHDDRIPSTWISI